MINIITSFSKYVFILLAAIFCLNGFIGHIFYAKNKKKGRIRKGIIQRIVITIIPVLGNVVLFINRKDFIFIVFLFMELFYFFFITNIFPIIYKKCNRILINDMAFLMSVGFLMLSRLNTEKAIRQYILVIAGTIIILIVPVLVQKFHKIITLKYVYAIIGIALLLVVFILGKTTYGANLSITLFGFTIQLSEFVKLSYVIFIAALLKDDTSLKQIIITSVLAAAHVLILIASNDLGMALVFFVTYVVMLFDATHQYRYLALSGGAFLLAGILAYFFVWHVKVRINVWTDPFKYIDDKGYQMVQAIFAIVNGGFFGTGLTRGMPGSIPVVTKDFIFPAISEEFGGLFGILLIMVCLNLFLEIITVLSENKARFNRLLLGGFGIMYIFQCFISIGGTINCIPNTGMTLPFVSYGGSSIISSMIMIAIVQGIAARNVDGADSDSSDMIRSPRMLFGSLMLVIIITGYYVYELFAYDQTILWNTYNRRITKMESNVVRGPIYASTGEELAYTIVEPDGTERRIYPFGSLFSHVIGYSFGEGAGLEGSLNYQLLSSAQSFENKIANELSGKKYRGNNVITTLDTNITKVVDEAIGDFKGAVVVMDDKGAILSMVSKPDYNPNTLKTVGVDKTLDAPLLNRAVNGLYPPGSTFKIVTLYSYLKQCISDNKYDEFVNFEYDCTGRYINGKINISCAHGDVHGKQNTHEALSNSCNGAFIKMGNMLDISKYADDADKLLFNKEIHYGAGIGPVTAVSSFVLNEESTMFDICQTSFGQGQTLITPIHNALIMQCIANNGILYEPYFVSSVYSSDNKKIYEYERESGSNFYGRLMNQDVALELNDHLRYVAKNRLAFLFENEPYEVYGKTGSAQVSGKSEHSLFVGYINLGDRKIIVSVVLEDYNEFIPDGGEADRMAVNVAKDIFSYISSLYELN